MRMTRSSCADGGADALRDGLQQLVAGLVAARVVDVLEAIQVEEQHREDAPRAARFRNRIRQMRGEEQAVRQTRELVVMREMIEMLLLLQELRFDLAAQADVVRAEGERPRVAHVQARAGDLDIDDAIRLRQRWRIWIGWRGIGSRSLLSIASTSPDSSDKNLLELAARAIPGVVNPSFSARPGWHRR